MTGFLDELSRLGRQQWLLRASVPLATVLMVAVQAAAGAPLHLVLPLLAVVLSLGVALFPDSGAGLVLVLLLGGHWLLAVPEQLGGWLLLAALILATIHLAATLAGYGPPSLVLDRVLLLLWGRRFALVAAATTVVWLAARVLSRTDGPGWPVGSALVVLAAWAAYLGRRLT